MENAVQCGCKCNIWVWVAASAGTPAVPFTTPGGGRFVRGMPWAGILGEF